MHHKNTILFCSIAIALLCSCSSHAAPEILNGALILEKGTSMPEKLASGNTVVITGSGFGTKLTDPPLRYDDFEDGVVGSVVPSKQTAGGWNTQESAKNVTYSDEEPRYTGAQSVKQEYIDSYGATFRLSNSEDPNTIPASTQELYVSGWFWFKMWDGLSLNTKFINMGCENVGKDNGWQTRIDGYPSDGSTNNSHLYAYLSDDCTMTGTDGSFEKADIHVPFDDLFKPDSAWHRIETYLRIGTNGYRDVSIDGVKIAEIEGLFTADNCSIGYLLIGHYFRLSDGIGEPKAIRYWDEVYVDVTRARVEIGDTSDFNSSSHREIQIPIKWNDGSLEITLNQGSFQTLKDKYLFVIDADNNPSKGYLLNQLLLPTITKPSIVQNFKIVQ